MATTVTRYVNTDSTAGGDGTTNGTAGANRAYATLNEALDAQQRDLVTADEEAEFICSGSADDTTPPTISSTWICDSTHRIIIRAAANHGGKWNTSTYRLVATGVTGVWCTAPTSTNVVHVEWWGIQFSMAVSNGSGSRSMFELAATSQAAGTTYRFTKCIMRQINNPSYTGATSRFFRTSDSDPENRWSHCLFYDFQGSALSWNSSVVARILNCTFINCSTPIGANGSVQIVRNCLFKGNTSIASATLHSSSNYNSADNASGPTNYGANSRLSQTFTFVDESNKDFHLASSDAGAQGFGEDLTGVTGIMTTEDIDSVARTSPWDIGADQVAEGGISGTSITLRILA